MGNTGLGRWNNKNTTIFTYFHGSDVSVLGLKSNFCSMIVITYSFCKRKSMPNNIHTNDSMSKRSFNNTTF